MKKRIIISVLLILFVAISSVNLVSAWWDTFECEGFNFDMPDGLTKAQGFSPSSPPNHIELISSDRSKWDYNFLDLSETHLEKLPDSLNIAENHTEGNLTIVKGQLNDRIYNSMFDGENITYAEFDKDGKHFYLVMEHYNTITLDEINLNDDIELVKKINESIQVK